MTKKICVDTNKPHKSGYETIVYHATTDFPKICETGIKASSEIEHPVLGSSKDKYDDTLSFTIDKNIAINILTIGDSFSQQGNIGYQNYLSSLGNLNIVNAKTNYFTKFGDYQLPSKDS